MPVSDYEVITVGTTPIGITDSKLRNSNGTYKWIKRAVFQVEGAGIRITRIDDVEPDNPSGVGLLIAAGTLFMVTGLEEILALKMIRSGDDNATVYVDLEQD